MLQNIHFDLENMCARTWDWTNYTQEQTQFAFKLHVRWNVFSVFCVFDQYHSEETKES